MRAVCLLACFSSALAQAAAFQVQTRTEAQAYQIRAYRESTSDAPVLLPRRRLVQYLSLNAFEIVTGEDFGFESNLRVFNDFGMGPSEAGLIDGGQSFGGDLLYASLQYRKGGFQAQLGRQIYVDVMDIMAFDGLRARYKLGLGLGAEAYGGLWVKGASFFGSSVYQPDGTRESDSRRLALGAPSASPELDNIEPVFGGKVFLEDLYGFGAMVGYRRAMVTGKIDIERGAAEIAFRRSGFNAALGMEYDLLMPRFSQIRATARYDQNFYAVSAEFLRLSPVLSSDSIWYYFATAPRDEVRVRGDWTPIGAFRFYGQLLLTRYNTEINNALGLSNVLQDPALPGSVVLGPNVGAAAKSRDFRTALDVTYRTGMGGSQLWVDLTGGYAPDSRPYSLDARLSVASVKDTLNPLLRGLFFGAQVWGSYALNSASRLSLMLEENVNPYTRSETKLFFLFDMNAML